MLFTLELLYLVKLLTLEAVVEVEVLAPLIELRQETLELLDGGPLGLRFLRSLSLRGSGGGTNSNRGFGLHVVLEEGYIAAAAALAIVPLSERPRLRSSRSKLTEEP